MHPGWMLLLASMQRSTSTSWQWVEKSVVSNTQIFTICILYYEYKIIFLFSFGGSRRAAPPIGPYFQIWMSVADLDRCGHFGQK